MAHLTDPDTARAVPASSSCCDPRVMALLAAADEHVAYIDVVLAENELRTAAARELVAS